MINRFEIKNSAKSALSTCYMKCVAVSLVLTLSLYGFYGGSGGSQATADSASLTLSSIPARLLPLLFGILSISFIISILIRVFLLKPLEIGCRKYFLYTHSGVQPIGIIASPYSNSYLNQVKILFFRDLFLTLWTMLFIIPGIVKSYSYRMIPYILAEDPSIDMQTAFSRSMEMMNGRKIEVFAYDLTFIGWYLLSSLTCGIVGIFYFYPYKALADAKLYKEIKNAVYGY